MNFAIDDNGFRIKPTPKGRGNCELCSGLLIAHCGEIYSWHWQHSSDRDCDPWNEHETEWHRKWKAKFPDAWQEVIIENYYEKHIADVQTNNGVVIEFQNSSISSSTICIREEFYGDMIWVINAESFKDNFSIRSVVNTQLRNLEVQFSTTSNFHSVYDEDIKRAEKKIANLEREIETKREAIENKKDKLETLKRESSIVSQTVEKILDKWNGKADRLWQLRNYTVIEYLEKIYNPFISSINERRMKLLSEQTEKSKSTKFMESLEQMSINGIFHKVIPYELIQKDKLHLFKAIEKDSIGTLFPKVYDILNEYEYLKYSYKQEQFSFLVNLNDVIKRSNARLDEISQALIDIEIELPKLRPELNEKLDEYFIQEIQKAKGTLIELNEEFDNMLVDISQNRTELHVLKQEKDDEENQIKASIEKDKADRKSKIMKEKKGLYNFDWKHERKTWKAANAPLFFDIGESYLFYKIREGTFKKVPITDFLSKYGQPNNQQKSASRS